MYEADITEGEDPQNNVERLAQEKSHELFDVCDKEKKGFITKRDMQRLQSELCLDPEQLEAVFDSLDEDKNGFLTLEEFTSGFGSFLGIQSPQDDDSISCENYEEDVNDKVEEEKQFNNMMESIGADKIIEDQSTVKALWIKIRHEEPELMSNFEDFLYKITSDIQRSKGDFESLEAALRSKNSAHDQEIQKLYEEMEYQIKQEKEKILSEEQLKERQLREAMEQELQEKDRQLQEFLSKHQDMEKRLSDLNQVETETKLENEKLMKEKESLEEMLRKSQENLEESKSYISQLRSQQKDEKRERARAALKLTENIALERESLVKQLDLLRDVNKKLRDDKDEAEIRRSAAPELDISDDLCQILEAEASSKRQAFRNQDPSKRGSILGNYFPQNRGRMDSTQDSISELSNDEDLSQNKYDSVDEAVDTVEFDDNVFTEHSHTQLHDHVDSHYINGRHSASGIHDSMDQASSSDGETVPKKARPRQKQHKRQQKKDTCQMEIEKGSNLAQCGEPTNVSDDFEEEGDNIDLQIASAYENIFGNRRESIFLETMEEYMSKLNEHSKESRMAGHSNEPKLNEHSKGSHLNECSTEGLESITESDHSRAEDSDSQNEKTDLKVVRRKSRSKRLKNMEDNSESGIPMESTSYPLTNSEQNMKNGLVPETPRGQPVGEDQVDSEVISPPRQRIFKVVFVGDSGVGKSSFIHRYCHDQFNPTFSATIGVDFQVQSLELEGQVIVLQLWDTAGQERFRSITKQYFRKADGVILMYDVSTEVTFTNVRNWAASVKEGVDEGTVMAVVGNKTDLCEEDNRVVKTRDGKKLSDEYGAIFFEVSAKSGVKVKECMESMASVLKNKEDDDLEKALHLEDPVTKKKGCCS